MLKILLIHFCANDNINFQLAHSCRNRTELDRATVKLRSIASAQSIQSAAISRKSKYRAQAASLIGGQNATGTISSTGTPKIKLGDSSKPPVLIRPLPEPERQYLRPKNLFQGVYFPCMGYILTGGVLAGTEVFPFSPKQEKLHFMHATKAPLGHLDGQENGAYLDSILVHMQIKMEAWDYPTRPDFLSTQSFTFHQVSFIKNRLVFETKQKHFSH